ncbi:zinc finger, CCHC-type containing protein [Tanacetum coccineum]
MLLSIDNLSPPGHNSAATQFGGVTMSVVYVLTTPMPKDRGDTPIVVQVRKRAKWDNDDYVCRGLILNGMSDSLFDIYQNVETSKELWDTLVAKYMAEDASSKKFLVSNFTNYKITNSRPVLEQYNELLGILSRFTQHKINMDESIQVSCIIDKLPPLWKDFKHTLKHLKEELTLVELGSHLRIEESLRANPGHLKKDWKAGNVGNKANGSGTKGSVYGSSNSLKGNESTTLVHGRGCVDLRLNIVSDNIGSAFMSTSKLNDLIIWHARLGHAHFKRMPDMSKDGLIPTFDMDTEKCKTCMLTKITKKPFQNVKPKIEVLELIHSDLCDLHAIPSLGNKKYFVTFIDDASRFCYVYLLHSKDEALDKFKVFKNEVELQQGSQIKRFKTDKGAEYMDTLYFQSVGSRAVVRLLDPKLKILVKEVFNASLLDMLSILRLYSVSINSIIESRDAIFDENKFSSVPRPSQRSLDVAFWEEAINDEMNSIMGNNTWVLADLSTGCKPLGCKWIFKRKLKVDGTIERFKARRFIQGFKQSQG